MLFFFDIPPISLNEISGRSKEYETSTTLTKQDPELHDIEETLFNYDFRNIIKDWEYTNVIIGSKFDFEINKEWDEFNISTPLVKSKSYKIKVKIKSVSKFIPKSV